MSSEVRLLQRSYARLRHLQVDPLTSLPDDHGMREIRLVLGDGHRSFIEALAMRLDMECDLDVVGTVWEPEETLRAVRAQPVDVAVLAVDGESADSSTWVSAC